MFRPEITPAVMNRRGIGYLPRMVGVEIVKITAEGVVGRLPVRADLLAPNGRLHAASVIALADTLAGYGTYANLPDGAKTFATIELKSNFLGTALDGVITCTATPVHLGRTTQGGMPSLRARMAARSRSSAARR